jgi:hypothetical protein
MLRNHIEMDEQVLGCKTDEILQQLPGRLSHAILDWAVKSPQAPALHFQEETWTFAQLAEAENWLHWYWPPAKWMFGSR